MTEKRHPIALQDLLQPDPHRIYAFAGGRRITRAELLSHAYNLGRLLPDKRYAVNLCADRYLFTVAFLAVIIRSQINLLPPNQAVNTIRSLLSDYDGGYCITDSPDFARGEGVLVGYPLLSTADCVPAAIDAGRTVSISFTSGSTGEPQAVEKSWEEFQRSALLAVERFSLNGSDRRIVSTAPPQHMYGLESSVFWPLFSKASVAGCRPFFPEDIRRAIAASEIPCLLASTPTHLNACVRAGLSWSNTAMVLSSTAPMTPDLAARVEHCFRAPLYEIFGSTETLSYASRRPAIDKKWRPYAGIKITESGGKSFVEGGHLAAPAPLDDRLTADENGFFSVLGRSSDLVKIAGKRASLSELNRLLNAIEGVEEGLFYKTETERLGALAVSRLDKKEILAELRLFVDEAFLPRPLHLVEKLPRNELGKIVKIKLTELIKELDIA
ncbi:MAG: AMP-binding protein [Gammaproteobacteria bacterium]